MISNRMPKEVSARKGLAIITGAAGGLGTAFAKQLARRGYRLLLVDRRAEPLENLCAEVAASYGVSAEPYVADFGQRDEVKQLARRIGQLPDLDLLVNNAGFGNIHHLVDTDPEVLAQMVDVHVVAPMLLTRAALPAMLERDTGSIINVSSLSAWFHSAGNAHYGSTKICLAAFTMTLHEELRGTNVRVQALCPGFVRTQFHDAESMKEFKRFSPAASMWASADDVAEYSLRRLACKQPVAIPGFGYRVIGRLAQMPMLRFIMCRITRLPRLNNASGPCVKPVPMPSGRRDTVYLDTSR